MASEDVPEDLAGDQPVDCPAPPTEQNDTEASVGDCGPQQASTPPSLTMAFLSSVSFPCSFPVKTSPL